MTVNVFLLQGGIVSIDGVITSAGMNTLAEMLDALPNCDVDTYLWENWSQAYHDVMRHEDHKIAVIGYSGGGMKATWLANGCVRIGGAIQWKVRPRIDLLVTYDPSPDGSMQVLHDNVRRAVNFHNKAPFFFGLGGGVLKGPKVETIDIAEHHLAVQYDQSLHARTVNFVKELMR